MTSRLRTLQRDWSQPHVLDTGLLPAFERIYEDTNRYSREYALCEDLVDLETQFQLWRFRHMRTVMRIIGFKRGTGGSSGVAFLSKALDLTFFPELFEVRTSIGPGKPMAAGQRTPSAASDCSDTRAAVQHCASDARKV